MTGAVQFSVDDSLATVNMARSHGNAINDELIDGLLESCRRAAADDGVRGVMLSASGRLFCPGLDLQELIDYDRPQMEAFLTRFAECILMLYTLPKPLVAALQGHAVAGGCILALTADWRVLRENALVGLNEIRVGVPFPFGVATILRESVPRARLQEVALLGRNYTNEEALGAGLVQEVRPDESFDAHCRERLSEMAQRDPRAFAVTKRYLRSSSVERIHIHDAQLQHEFLDCWFAPATRERMRHIVDGLRGT